MSAPTTRTAGAAADRLSPAPPAPAGAHPLAGRLRAGSDRAVAELRGKVVVVKYGGAVMDDPARAASWALDVALAIGLGARVVVVHGGGPALTRTLARLGIASTFADGHRVTDAESAEVAEMVLSGRTNKAIVSLLQRAGVRAVGLSGTDGALLRIRPHRPGGRDIGFVGEIAAVESGLLLHLLEGGYTPVISSTAASGTGQPYNINADLVAGAVASALGSAELLFLSDVDGCLVDGRTLATMDVKGTRELLGSGAVTGGMRPKLEGALRALDAGVPRVRLLDGRVPHALVRALFLGDALGTVIAGMSDAQAPNGHVARSAGSPSSASSLPGLTHIGGRAVTPKDRPAHFPARAETVPGTPQKPKTWSGTLTLRGASAVMDTYARYPVEIAEGSGCRVIDSAGRSYLDFTAGIAVSALGHRHPAIVEAIRSGAEGVLHASNLYWTEPMVALAERLTHACGMERAFFCNSGTEAIETALKVVRKARPGRSRIVVFERSFHGRTLGALSATIQSAYQDPFRPLVPGFTALPYGDFDAVEQGLDGTVSAVLVEPIQGEGGVRPAPAGWLAHLRAACDRAGALLVLDEVQTGIGRTGHLFAFQGEGVVPDAVASAKALGGGLPIGVLLARGEAARALRPGDHGCTFGGGPFITSVASAVLDVVLAPGFLDEVRAKGERLGAALRAIVNAHPTLAAEARGRGLMWGLALRGPLAPALVAELQEHGLLAVPAGKDVLRLVPPLTVSEEEIDTAASLIAKGLFRVETMMAAAHAMDPASKCAGAERGSDVG